MGYGLFVFINSLIYLNIYITFISGASLPMPPTGGVRLIDGLGVFWVMNSYQCTVKKSTKLTRPLQSVRIKSSTCPS